MRRHFPSFTPQALLRDRKTLVFGIVLLLLLLVLVASTMGSDEPDPVGGPPMVRRLTEEQYRNSIADIFAPDIDIPARFEKPLRAEGMIAIGTGESGMSPFAVEQYDAAAQSIAATVLSEKRRAQFVPCRPADEKRFDAACARRFLTEKGRLLFRRPLTKDEADKYVSLASEAQAKLGNFYDGLEFSLYTMLVAPDFLFRIERAEPGWEGKTAQLDPYSKASRLSFFLTNSTPDEELLRAAQEGELDSSSGVEEQANRLMASPRYAKAVRAFFADMLQFDRFDDLSKDPAIYPAFNSDVAADAQEQTLRTIVEQLIDRNGDYRELFTTRDTFLTRALGVIYRTPVEPRDGWQAVTFAPDAHRAGIQSQISFLALHSHPGRSSPTLRGYAVRQIFLCQEVPDPPPTVNFAAIEADAHTKKVTARDRLKQHATDASCAGCHKVMDPVGLSMENFDGLGAFRTQENGATIDTSGFMDGMDFDDPEGLGEALYNHPETPRCVAQRLYNSAVGRDITWGERYYLDWLIDAFEDDGYRIPDLMRKIVLSKNFFTVTPPAPETRERTIVEEAAGTGEKI